MRELDDQFQLPEDEMAAVRVIKISQRSDAAPSKWAILGITVLVAAHVPEIASYCWEYCLRRNTN